MHHYMLLHIGMPTVYHKKMSEEDGKEDTHITALSVSEQALLITCKVNVTTADGSSTITRALIDPGSSASFVHERLAKHLCLPRIKKCDY